MAELAEKDKHLLEAAFYEKPFYFSYSSLSKLLIAPNVFYKEYILKEREIRTEKHLLEGILIHYLLLDNKELFDETFIVTPEDLPSENSIKVVYMVFEKYKELVEQDLTKADLMLCDFPEEVDAILLEMNLHQAVKDKDKRIAKIVEPKAEAYFEYLKNKGGREIIDSGTLDKCALAAELIKKNQNVIDLLGMTIEPDGINFGVYNELHLTMALENFPFGLQGVLDNMVVDVQNRTIRINDFKTSGKTLVDFPESVEYWKYWLQAAIYVRLAMEFLKEVINSDWTIEVHFVVYDKYDQVFAFPVSSESLLLWNLQLEQVLNEAKWHYENKDYTLPYKFIAGEVKL